MNNFNNDNILDNFIVYIQSVEPQTFLGELISNTKLSNEIIKNNLYWKNLDMILKKFRYDLTLEFFKILYFQDKENKFFNEEMYTLLEDKFNTYILFPDIIKLLESKKDESLNIFYRVIGNVLRNKKVYLNEYVIRALYESEHKKIIEDNLQYILDGSYDILEMIDILSQEEKLLNIIKDYINKNPDNLIYGILSKGFKLEVDIIKEQKIFDTIKIIIDELLANEKLSYSDIKYLDEGALSYVVSIGSKVMKVGSDRDTFIMDNNKRFLKPLLRTKINILDCNMTLGCIEVTEKVDTENITEEDAYLLYKELRDSGYYWIDCKKNNIGRLIRKNKVYMDNLEPSKEAINYKTDCPKELNEGELVIIDNDLIYTEEEFEKLPYNIKQICLESVEEYELKYQMEKNNKKL